MVGLGYLGARPGAIRLVLRRRLGEAQHKRVNRCTIFTSWHGLARP
jgi:hypothetical protein